MPTLSSPHRAVAPPEPAPRHYAFVAGDGRRATSLLLVEGDDPDAVDLTRLAAEIAPGAATIRPSAGAFGSYGPDGSELLDRAADLIRVARAAAARHRLDRDRLVLVGAQDGADLGLAVALSEPSLFAALVLVSPGVEPRHLDGRGEGLRVLLLAEREDGVGLAAWSLHLAAFLRARGADVTLRWRDRGPRITTDEAAAAAEWFLETPPRSWRPM